MYYNKIYAYLQIQNIKKHKKPPKQKKKPRNNIQAYHSRYEFYDINVN